MRIHFLGQLLRSDTGRAFHGRALNDIQRRQVIKRADYLAYERKVNARRFTRRVVLVCGVVLAVGAIVHLVMR